MDNDKLVDSVFIDLSKATDIVDHSILLQKLEGYSVKEKRLNGLEDISVTGGKECALERPGVSGLTVKRGVLQGSILGPLLFIWYVNDLPQVTRNSTVTQYADSTTMTVVAKDATSLGEQLNEDLSIG